MGNYKYKKKRKLIPKDSENRNSFNNQKKG